MSRKKINIAKNHGVRVFDKKYERAQCNYCEKRVSGFQRLKFHLAKIRGDVKACPRVPKHVRKEMRQDIIQNMDCQGNKVWKSSNSRRSRKRKKQSAQLDSMNHENTETPGGNGSRDEEDHETIMSEPSPNSSVCDGINFSESASEANCRRKISRFFYGCGLNPNIIGSPLFVNMIHAIKGCQSQFQMPTPDELQGCMLEDELKDLNDQLTEIKKSLGRTGCTILFDEWINRDGRILFSFTLDCPQGTLFLKAVDVSDIADDINALVGVVSGVIADIGKDNVVQIITNETTYIVKDIKRIFKKLHKHIFWTHCAAQCIDKMLGRIANLEGPKEAIHGAKKLTSFMHIDAELMHILRTCIDGRELVSRGKTLAITDFLTLERIDTEKENLKRVFDPQLWVNSRWEESQEISEIIGLVSSTSFWKVVSEAVKIANPLINVMELVYAGDRPTTGFIYEAMDRAKEAIASNLNEVGADHEEIWNVIDEIWNERLHSPLHGAGHFFNPEYFYSQNYYEDDEVIANLKTCLGAFIPDKAELELLFTQIKSYKKGKGIFGSKKAFTKSERNHPVAWWSAFAEHLPQLQKIAIRVLSQTCAGIQFEQLRSIIEQVHDKECVREERMEMEKKLFVQVNHCIERPSSIKYNSGSIWLSNVNALGDWVVRHQAPQVHDQGSSQGGVDDNHGTPEINDQVSRQGVLDLNRQALDTDDGSLNQADMACNGQELEADGQGLNLAGLYGSGQQPWEGNSNFNQDAVVFSTSGYNVSDQSLNHGNLGNNYYPLPDGYEESLNRAGTAWNREGQMADGHGLNQADLASNDLTQEGNSTTIYNNGMWFSW